MGAAAPTTMLSGPEMGLVERYGIGGVMAVLAWLFYRQLQESNKLRDAANEARLQEHKARIAILENEIRRIRGDSPASGEGDHHKK